MLNQRIMLPLLAVMCCLFRTIKADLTPNAANECLKCKSPVYERADANKTQADVDIMEAMPCGHHIRLHNDCSNALMISDAERTVVPCPSCGISLKLNHAMKEKIKDDQQRQLLAKMEKTNILRGWPY